MSQAAGSRVLVVGGIRLCGVRRIGPGGKWRSSWDLELSMNANNGR